MKCLICLKQMKIRGFSNHLKWTHNITSKEYYDEFLKKEDEGFCLQCGNKTKFIKLSKGYYKYCGNECKKKSKNNQEKKSQTYLKHCKENKNFKLDIIKKRKKTCLKKYNVTHNFNIFEVSIKRKQTCLKKYGVLYPFKSKEIQEKIKQTNLKKFGSFYPMQNLEFHKKIMKIQRSKKIKTGQWINPDDLKGWELYCYLVNQETYKWKPQLYDNWNGLDYYTNKKLISNEEFKKIEPNKHINSNLFQPTIDHKISKMRGFQEGILPNIIGHLNNLCICSQSSNSKKGIN